jgi:FXSXX-COOH protein
MYDEPLETGGLIDVSGLTLADLDELDASPLAHAIRRLLTSAEGDLGPIAAFNQSVDRGTEPVEPPSG